MRSATISKAASLILSRPCSRINTLYNYQLLLLQRKQTMSSFNSVLAFPGGKQDLTIDQQIVQGRGIREIGVATALRECFEETGLYVARDAVLEIEKLRELEQIRLRYIAEEFYRAKTVDGRVDEKHLSNLFMRLATVIAPCGNLLPFLRLVTVPSLPKRYDTLFYLHHIQQFKLINFLKYAQHQKHLHNSSQIIMNQQFNSYRWYTPIQVLNQFINKRVKLAPPQFMMLNIMSNFHKYNQLEQFINNCARNTINMGPNVVSVVKNRGYGSEEYAYAATLLGDAQFPYQWCYGNQKDQGFVGELRQWEREIKGKFGQEVKKNRILFKKPTKFFEEPYETECNIEGSVFSKFISWEKLIKKLQTTI